MEITGTLKQIFPTVSGEGKNGPWSKRDILIETEGAHPKKVVVTLFGDKINIDGIAIDSKLTAYIDIASNEFNGKWYTNVTAWKIESQSAGKVGKTERSYSSDKEEVPVAADDLNSLPF